MTLSRGDIALARFPHTAGARGKKRPVVIVQADTYNQALRHVVVAEVTKNLATWRTPPISTSTSLLPKGRPPGSFRNRSWRACCWRPSTATG